MSAVCPAISSDAGIVERLAAYVECQSQQIDLAAFQGGLWHGLPAVLISALMVLYVAGFGYRLILHRHLDTASLVYATLRLGIVIAVTTTFGAYSTLIYNVSIQGPAELANMALAPAGLHVPGLTEASHAAAGYLDTMTSATQPEAQAQAQTQPQTPQPAPAAPPVMGSSPPQPQASTTTATSLPTGSGRDVGGALFMLSCTGFGLAARLAQAVVLAAAPLFMAAALFDVSTGLFIGWLRAFVALFLAQTGYAVTCALELSFLAHDLDRLSSSSASSGDALMLGLFFLMIGTGITVMAVLAAGGLLRVGMTLREGATTSMTKETETPQTVRSPWSAPEINNEAPVSRVQRVTDAVSARALNDASQAGASYGPGRIASVGATPGTSQNALGGGVQGLRRPGQLRASTVAAKRDLMT